MKATKRLLAIVLVLIMSLSVMGVSAYAEIISIQPVNNPNVNAAEPVVVEEPVVVVEEPVVEEPIVLEDPEDERSSESELPMLRMMMVRPSGAVSVSDDADATILPKNGDSISAGVTAAAAFSSDVTALVNEPLSAPDTLASTKNITIVGTVESDESFTGDQFITVNSGNVLFEHTVIIGKATAPANAIVVAGGTVSFNGATIKSFTGNGIRATGGTVELSGNTIYDPVIAAGGTVNVKSGDFKSDTSLGTASLSCTSGTMNISGGDFDTGVLVNVSGGTVNISGGTFKTLPTKTSGSLNIIGGSFVSNPTSLLASGYEAKQASTGALWVVSAKDNVATVNGAAVADAAALIAAVASSSADTTEVIMLKDVNMISDWELGVASKAININLNGKTLTSTLIANAGTLTVSGGTVSCATSGITVKSGATLNLGGAAIGGNINLQPGSVLNSGSGVTAGIIKVTEATSAAGNAMANISGGNYTGIEDVAVTGGVSPSKTVTGGSFTNDGNLSARFVKDGYSVVKGSGSYPYVVSAKTASIKNASNNQEVASFTYYKGSDANSDLVFNTNLPVSKIEAFQGEVLFGVLEEKNNAVGDYDYELTDNAMKVTIKTNAEMFSQAAVGSGKFTLRFTFSNGQSKNIVMNIAPAIAVNPADAKHTTGDGADMVFTSSDAFKEAYIIKPGTTDMVAIAVDNKTVSSDSKTLTLKKAYLDTLASGTYQVVFDFGNGGQFAIPIVINKASTATSTAKPTIVSATGDAIPYASALLTAGLNFKVTPADNIGSVTVDGVVLTDTVHYTLSTAGVLNLKSNYLMSLLFGDHTITVTNVYGSASMTFRTGPGILPLNGIRTHTKGGSNTLTYVTTHPITSIAVAGTTIASTNYALSADGKTITFTAAFLNSLQVGTYSVTATVNTGDGYLRQVSSSMVIISQYAAASTPATGDTSNLGLWIGLMVAALALLAVVVFILKKKPEEAPAENVKSLRDK